MFGLPPEVEGSGVLPNALARENLVATLGHSLADGKDFDAAIDRGLTYVTHLFNAMGPMHHHEPGVPGLALSDDRLACDLICRGVHAQPRMMRPAACPTIVWPAAEH